MKELVEARIRQLEAEQQKIKLTVAHLYMGLKEAKVAKREIAHKLEEEVQLLAAIAQKEATDAGAASSEEEAAQEAIPGVNNNTATGDQIGLTNGKSSERAE